MAADALARLQVISHEYALLQIAKLHDKAVVAGEVTLGVQYVVKYGGWNEPVLSELKELAEQLEHFARGLRGLRNKVLSHNDLAAILAQVALGDFEKDEDVKYFKLLQKFVDTVHSEVIGGPRPFDDLAKNDVIAFMAMVRQ
jgi:hypothetical protein